MPARASKSKPSSGPDRIRQNGAAKKRDPERMRQRILAAATKEFSAHGYAGARVEQIAKRARTVDRMLYYYFGSKEDLYVAVLEQAYEALVSSQASLNLQQAEPVQGLRDLIRYSWEFYLAHPEMIRLFNAENLHLGRHVRRSARIRKLSLPVINTLRDLTERGVTAGVFRPGVDPVELYITVAALGYFYVSNRYTLSQFLSIDLMQPKARAAWMQHITDLVLSHLRAHNEAAAVRPSARAAARRARPAPSSAISETA